MNEKVQKFLNRPNYGWAENNYSEDDFGVWEVYGEDSNCDMGGSHKQPFLGLFRGKYIDVVTHAVELSGFWAWGRGGDIKPYKEPEIIDLKELENKRILEKLAEYRRLEEELKKAKMI